MSIQALLAARAHTEGRAQRSAVMRHRALSDDPLCIVAWQLGSEPYSVGAIAAGTKRSGYELFVPGYPLDRHLLLASLLDFARLFCPKFESFQRGPREPAEYMGETLQIPKRLPQIVVANTATIALLGRLGRRLAYQPVTGPNAADPLLPRLGRHLNWLVEHAQLPGQQLLVSLTDLLAQHYVTATSSLEMQSLAAADAWIDPGREQGFHAAELAERKAVGPAPAPEDAREIQALMKTLNEQRAGSKDPARVNTLAQPLRRLYDRMVGQTWSLIWRVVDRERATPEAPSVTRRARDDRIEYAAQLAWMNGPAEGRRKTRMTPRGAAIHLDRLERARTKLLAEEAIDDPLRMAPHLLAGKALAGVVTRVDSERRERVSARNCRRPAVTVRTSERCTIPSGTELWWTRIPDGKEWRIESVVARADSGSDVTLVLQTNRLPKDGLPTKGSRVCFSQFNTKPPYELFLPSAVPWTHKVAEPTPDDLEGPGASGGQAA